jgi:hypothetical protein
MRDQIREQLEACVEALRRGELTEQRLREVIDAVRNTPPPRQDLLYLQAGGTSLTSGVHGMLMVRDGEVWEGPDNPDEWPYKTVLEAIRDGWRVVQFPNLALMLDESRTYGLGAEFILEKWR